MLDGSLELLSTFDYGRLLFKGETPPFMISVSGITGCTGNPRVRAFRDGQLIEPVSCGLVSTNRYLLLAPLSPQIRTLTLGHQDHMLAEFVGRGGAIVDPGLIFYTVP